LVHPLGKFLQLANDQTQFGAPRFLLRQSLFLRFQTRQSRLQLPDLRKTKGDIHLLRLGKTKVSGTFLRGGGTGFACQPGNTISVTDPDGNTTTMAYDSLNRLIQQTDPLNNSATFAYDAASRETSTTDRNGNVINYSYDNANRQTGQTWIVSGSTVNLLTFTYDKAGNQLTAANYAGRKNKGDIHLFRLGVARLGGSRSARHACRRAPPSTSTAPRRRRSPLKRGKTKGTFIVFIWVWPGSAVAGRRKPLSTRRRNALCLGPR
jgi:YD repeat-containing protein